MGELLDEMQRRLDAWREKQAKQVEPPKTKPKSQQNFVSRRDYGDDIEFMRGENDKSDR